MADALAPLRSDTREGETEWAATQAVQAVGWATATRTGPVRAHRGEEVKGGCSWWMWAAGRAVERANAAGPKRVEHGAEGERGERLAGRRVGQEGKGRRRGQRASAWACHWARKEEGEAGRAGFEARPTREGEGRDKKKTFFFYVFTNLPQIQINFEFKATQI